MRLIQRKSWKKGIAAIEFKKGVIRDIAHDYNPQSIF